MNSLSIASAFTDTQNTATQNAAQKQNASSDSAHVKENTSSFGHVYNSNNQPVEEKEEHTLFDAVETERVDPEHVDPEDVLSSETPDQNPNVQDDNASGTDDIGTEAKDGIFTDADDTLDAVQTEPAESVDANWRDQSSQSFKHLKTRQDLPPTKIEFSSSGSRLEGADQISKPSIQNTDTLPNKDVAQHAILGQTTVSDPSKLLQPSKVAQMPDAQIPTLETPEVSKSALTDRASSVSPKSETNIPVDTKQGSAALVLPNKPNVEPKVQRKDNATLNLAAPRTSSSSDPYSASKSVSELAHSTAMQPNVYSGTNITSKQSSAPISLAKSEPRLVRDNDTPIITTELRATGSTPSANFVGQVASSNQENLARHVSMQISEALRNTAQRPVEISLNPAELGRLRMTVTTIDGAVTLQVLAERPETLDLMRRNMDSLSRDLSDLGFTSIDLAFGQGKDADAEKRTTGSPSGLSQTESVDQQENADPQIALPATHLDGSGRLDIRV